MTECIDQQIGQQLHAWEMNWLTEDEANAFEVHCMHCPHCFEEIEAFQQAALTLASDEEAKAMLATAADSSRTTTSRARIIDLLWPKTNIIFRPALAWAAILLLLPFAYQGLNQEGPAEDRVATIDTVDLTSQRGISTVIEPNHQSDLLLRFSFGSAVPGQAYQVILASQSGVTIFEDAQFAFSNEQLGQLRIPAGVLMPGTYWVVISDPSDPSILGTDTLKFRVEE